MGISKNIKKLQDIIYHRNCNIEYSQTESYEGIYHIKHNTIASAIRDNEVYLTSHN
jgi:hypothetical protein